ncbi:MAG: PAS domain S-box protein [Sedimentisphaerales bacterium]|nr:PAS domain S-box protein [Sedimentisphaerales bacterium]
MDRSHKSAAELQRKVVKSLVEPLRRAGSGSSVKPKVIECLRSTQQELDQVQKNYSAVFDLAPVGYIAVYEDSAVKEINSTAACMLGHHRLDILGNPLVIYVQPQGRDTLRKHFQKVFAGNEDTIELIFDRNNSKSFIGRLHSSIIQDESPHRCCLCTLTDMSEKITAQRQLHERQDQLRQIEQRSKELEYARAELENEVHKRSHALDLSQQQIEQLNVELQQQHIKHRQIESQLKQQQSELEIRKIQQQEELEKLKKKLSQKDDEYTRQLQDKDKQIQDRQEACRRLEKALDLERKRLIEAETRQAHELRQLQEKRAQQQVEQEKVQQELQARRQQSLTTQDGRTQQLQETNTELQKRLAEMRITEQKLQRRVEQFHKYVRFRTQRLNEASAHLQQLQRRNERLSNCLSDQQKRYSIGIRQKSEEFDTLRFELHKAKEQHKGQTDRLRHQLARLTTIVQAKKNQLQKLSEKKKEQRTAGQQVLHDLRAERRNLGRRVRQAENRIKQLQNRLHEQTQSSRNMQRLLHESEQMLETTCRLAQIGRWTLDLTNDHFSTSQQFQRLLGLKSSDDILDLNGFLHILPPDEQKSVNRIFREPPFKRKSFQFEHRVETGNGIQRVLLHCAKCIKTKEASLLIGVCRDITDWRNQETKMKERAVLLEQSVMQYKQRIETLEKEIRQRAMQYRTLETKLLRQHDSLHAQLKHTEQKLRTSINDFQTICNRHEQEDSQAREHIEALRSNIKAKSEQLEENEKKLEIQQARIEQLQNDWASRQRQFEHVNAESARQFRSITEALRERVFRHARKRRTIEQQRDEMQQSLEALGQQLAQTKDRFAKQIMDHKRIQQQLTNERQVLQKQLESHTQEMEHLNSEMERQQKDHCSQTQRLTEQITSLRTELQMALQSRSDRNDSQMKEQITDLQILLAERTDDLENVLQTASMGLHQPLADLARCADRLEELCHRHHLVESRPTLECIFDRLGEAGNFIQALSQLSDAVVEELDEINVNLIIEDILKENTHFSRNNITFHVDKLPPCRADALQLKKVFTQLIDNAVKFQKTGTDHCVWIDGRTEGRTSIYCVEDNGIGMQPEKLDHAFGMFTQIDPASTPGWGIGLAVIKRIIESHGGQITVETQPDIGSKFFVTLPR